MNDLIFLTPELLHIKVMEELNKHGIGSISLKGKDYYQLTFRYENEQGKIVPKSVGGKSEELCRKKKYEFFSKLIIQRQQAIVYGIQQNILENKLNGLQYLSGLQQLPEIEVPDKKEKGSFKSEISDYIDYINKSKLALATKHTQMCHARLIGRKLKVSCVRDTTKAICNEFLNDILQKKDGSLRAKSSMKQIMAQLKDFLYFCDNKGYMSDCTNITGSLKMPKGLKNTDPAERYVELFDIADLLESVKENIRYTVIVYLVSITGIRGQEVFSLELEDIDRQKKILSINNAIKLTEKKNATDRVYAIGDTKSVNGVRYVPVTDLVLSLIDLWWEYTIRTGIRKKAIQKGNGNIIFVNRDGNIMNRESFSAAFKKYLSKRTSNITLHTLRHSTATHYTRNDAPVKDVALMLGHKVSISEVTEKVYIAKGTEYALRLVRYSKKVEKEILKNCNLSRTMSEFRKKYGLKGEKMVL